MDKINNYDKEICCFEQSYFSIIPNQQTNGHASVCASFFQDIHLIQELTSQNTQKQKSPSSECLDQSQDLLSEEGKSSDSQELNENETTISRNKEKKSDLNELNESLSLTPTKCFKKNIPERNTKMKARFQNMDSKSAKIAAAIFLNTVQNNVLEGLKDRD